MKLVLVHGMWAGPWCWDRFIPLFREKGWDCLAPCLRGHCGSNGNVGKLSIEDYAGDLEKLAGHFPEKPVVIGHSMGGLLAQILAGRGVVAGAVMLGPASPAGIAPVSAVAVFGALSAAGAGGTGQPGPLSKRQASGCLMICPRAGKPNFMAS